MKLVIVKLVNLSIHCAAIVFVFYIIQVYIVYYLLLNSNTAQFGNAGN